MAYSGNSSVTSVTVSQLKKEALLSRRIKIDKDVWIALGKPKDLNQTLREMLGISHVVSYRPFSELEVGETLEIDTNILRWALIKNRLYYFGKKYPDRKIAVRQLVGGMVLVRRIK